jgi:hypothetical protein
MGIGPIPYNVIMDYARIHGLEDDIVPMFALVIRTMDGVYLEWEMAASKARAEANE